MQFMIPKSTSRIQLFVTSKDYYVPKDRPSEFRVTIEALVPAGSSRPNKHGFSVAAFAADRSVYEQLPNISETGPLLVEFEAEPRDAKNGYGGSTNSEFLTRILSIPSLAPATAPAAKDAKG